MNKKRVGTAGGIVTAAILATLTGLLLLQSETFDEGREASIEPTPVVGKIYTMPGRQGVLRKAVEGLQGVAIAALSPPTNFDGKDFYDDPDMEFVDGAMVTGYEFMQLNRDLTRKVKNRGATPPNHAEYHAWIKVVNEEISMRGGLECENITADNLVDVINIALER